MTETWQRGVHSRAGRSRAAAVGSFGHLLRRGPSSPMRSARAATKAGGVLPEQPEGGVHCRACGAPVTSEADMLPVAGQTLHHRTNPLGVAYTFGCFGAAPGAEPVGSPTALYTWFTGYAWRIARCRGCLAHLGWRFEGGAEFFYGLILDRLATRSAAGGGSA